MLRQVWRMVRVTVLVLGIALGFFAVIEVLRAYEVLNDLHPVLGVAFGICLLAGGAWLAVRYAVTVARRPVILVPPRRGDLDQARRPDLHAWGRYLVRVTKRLEMNPNLSETQCAALGAGQMRLRRMLRGKASVEQLVATLQDVESSAIQPAIDALDRLGEKEVRRCVRDVMLAVTLSPWRSVDLLVVIHRNVAMVGRILTIYNARPRLREQALVFKDVLTVVATVNYLNYGSQLSRNLLSTVPGLGRFTDDVAQGAGAGLLTSVAGHSARERCRDFRGWDQAEAQRTVVNRLGRFMADIKGMMLDQVLPHLQVDFVERARSGIAAAIDETTKATDVIVRRPIVVAGRGIGTTGAAVTQGIMGGTAWTLDAAGRAGKATGRAIERTTQLGWRAASGIGRAAVRVVRNGVGVPRRRNQRNPEASKEDDNE